MFNYRTSAGDEEATPLVTRFGRQFMLPYWDPFKSDGSLARFNDAAGEAGAEFSSGLQHLSATGNTRLSRWLSPKPTC